MRISLIHILVIISTLCYSQQEKIDSIKNLPVPANLKVKVDRLNEFSYFYCILSTDSSLFYAKKALKLADSIHYQLGLAKSNINIGRVYYYQDNYAMALEWDIKGLETYQAMNDEKGIADCYRNIGNVYLNQNQYKKSKEYYEKGMNLYLKLNDKKGLANCLRGLGNVQKEDSLYNDAMASYKQAMVLYREINDFKNQGTCVSSIGTIFHLTGQVDSALIYYTNGLNMKEKIGDKKGIAIILNSLGNIYFDKKDFRTSEKYLRTAAEVAGEIKSMDILNKCYESLAFINAQKRDYVNAYHYYVLYKQTGDSLLNKENLRKQTELEMKYQFEQEKEKAALEQKRLDDIKNAEMKQTKLIRNASVSGLFLMLLLVLLVYWNYRNKKKANALLTTQKLEIEEKNSILNQQNEEIKAQRDELELQSKFLMKQGDKIASQNQKIKDQMAIVNLQKKEIVDSIHYAKRIQLAILPPYDYIQNNIKEVFILYKPKDVVSGDFYWFERKNEFVMLSAVDCTGHGVPGAFMSIVGNNGLDKAVRDKNATHPGQILDLLDDFVVETLRQTDKTEVKDGMDIALCSFNEITKTVEFAGANNPLYIVRKKTLRLICNEIQLEPVLENELYSIYEIKGDKQPIGAVDKRKQFNYYSFVADKDDTYYIFSDGYADQFGGPNGKKFKYSKLKELILTLQEKTLSEQREILNTTFEDWKGKLEQIDDILVLGMKFI